MCTCCPVDVYLRGNRDYVQGTQMIARVAELVDETGAVLKQANFTKISDRMINVYHGENTDGQQAEAVGQVKFESADGLKSYSLLESVTKAERRNLDMGITCLKQPDLGSLHGKFIYSGAKNLEDALNVIVQSIKALHEELSDEIFDIWLTGIRRFPLPIDWPREYSDGIVCVQGQRIMHSGESYQSLLRVVFSPRAEPTTLSGFVTFAFKSREQIVVD